MNLRAFHFVFRWVVYSICFITAFTGVTLGYKTFYMVETDDFEDKAI